MSSSHHRRAGKHGEQDEDGPGSSLPARSNHSRHAATASSSESNGGSSPKNATSLFLDVTIVDDEVSALTSLASMEGAPPGKKAPPAFEEEKREEQAFEEDEDLRRKPAAAPSVASKNSRASLYPDISDIEQQESAPSEHIKDFIEGNSKKNDDKNKKQSAPTPSHPHANAANRKQRPPPPTPPSVASASAGLSLEEEAAKNRVRSNMMPPPNVTPGAVMVPGIRATEPWVPNNDEEDPEIKSVGVSPQGGLRRPC